MVISTLADREITKTTRQSGSRGPRAPRAFVTSRTWLVCVLLLNAASARAEIIDRVLAVVGGVVITLSDVTAASELRLVTVAAADDRTGAVLAQLVDRQLILGEVDRYAPPEPTAEAVDREAQLIRAKFGSTDAYGSVLSRAGTDEKHLRQTLRDELRIRGYLEQRFTVPPPSDEELNRYYRDHLQEFTRGGQVVPLEAARTEVAQAVAAARRKMLVEEWVSGLRRRTPITDLYVPRR